MEYLVWVGPRDSDIQFSKCFKESICYFSEKNPNSDRKAHICLLYTSDAADD